jgi:hypothetical protein
VDRSERARVEVHLLIFGQFELSTNRDVGQLSFSVNWSSANRSKPVIYSKKVTIKHNFRKAMFQACIFSAITAKWELWTSLITTLSIHPFMQLNLSVNTKDSPIDAQ